VYKECQLLLVIGKLVVVNDTLNYAFDNGGIVIYTGIIITSVRS